MIRIGLFAFALASAVPAALAQTPSKIQSKQVFTPAPTKALPRDEPPPHAVGRFRVTITGFVAVEQTWDDSLQRDGKDDEVFLLTETRLIQATDNVPSVIEQTSARSLVMGDTNGFQPEDRIRAGQASEDGGIQSGNKVGTTGTRLGEPRENRIPMRVWEGEIQDNMSVLIVPTIWEWDGAPSALEQLVGNLLVPVNIIAGAFDGAAMMPDRRRDSSSDNNLFVSRFSEMLTARDVVGSSEVQEQTVVGTQADRPIGMTKGNGNTYRFDPWVISFGLKGARTAAAFDRGYGPGVIVLHYVDGPALNGKYDLYLQVEELP